MSELDKALSKAQSLLGDDDFLDDDDIELDDADIEAQLAEIEGKTPSKKSKEPKHKSNPEMSIDQQLAAATKMLNADIDEHDEYDDIELTDEQLEAVASGRATMDDFIKKRKDPKQAKQSPKKSSVQLSQKEQLILVETRKHEFIKAAQDHRRISDQEGECYCLKISSELDAMIKMIKKGKTFDVSNLPEPPKAVKPKDPHEEVYSLLTKALEKQSKTCSDNATRYHKYGKSDLAKKMESMSDAYKKQQDRLQALRLAGKAPPKYKVFPAKFEFERYNYDVQPKQIKFQIVRCLGIIPPDGMRENDLKVSVQVTCKLPGINGEQKRQTDRVSSTSMPEFNQDLTFEMSELRDASRISRAKVSIEIFTRKGMMMFAKDVLIGQLLVDLNPLQNQCEIHQCLPVGHPSKKKKFLDWKIEFKVMTRQSLSGKVDQVVEEHSFIQLDFKSTSEPVGVHDLKAQRVMTETGDIIDQVSDIQSQMTSSVPANSNKQQQPVGAKSVPLTFDSSKLTLPSVVQLGSIAVAKKRYLELNDALKPFSQKIAKGAAVPIQVKKAHTEQKKIHAHLQELGNVYKSNVSSYAHRLEQECVTLKKLAMAFKQQHDDKSSKAAFIMYKTIENELKSLKPALTQPQSAPSTSTPTSTPTSTLTSTPPNLPSVPRITEIPSYTALEQMQQELSQELAPHASQVLSGKPLPKPIQLKFDKSKAIKKRMEQLASSLNPEDVDGICSYIKRVNMAMNDYSSRANAFKSANRQSEYDYLSKLISTMKQEVDTFSKQLASQGIEVKLSSTLPPIPALLDNPSYGALELVFNQLQPKAASLAPKVMSNSLAPTEKKLLQQTKNIKKKMDSILQTLQAQNPDDIKAYVETVEKTIAQYSQVINAYDAADQKAKVARMIQLNDAMKQEVQMFKQHSGSQ